MAQINLFDEITVDGFCGGGGWSTGFELGIGRPVDIGINHDAAAIALHKKKHLEKSILPWMECRGNSVLACDQTETEKGEFECLD